MHDNSVGVVCAHDLFPTKSSEAILQSNSQITVEVFDGLLRSLEIAYKYSHVVRVWLSTVEMGQTEESRHEVQDYNEGVLRATGGELELVPEPPVQFF